MFRVPEITYLKHIAEAAARIDGAVGGMVSLVDGSATSLRLAAHCGLPVPFTDAVANVPLDEQTSCAQAARERRRVVIRDVFADPAFRPYIAVAESAGFRGVQSTPLVDREHRLLGVLSTFFKSPHHPSTESLKEIDTCARLAVRLIEAATIHADASAADRRLGIPPRPLSPAASQAADAARTLLPAVGRDGGFALVNVAERHLSVVVDEISHQMRREVLHSPSSG